MKVAIGQLVHETDTFSNVRTDHGVEIGRYRTVALKSSQHFRAAFEEIAQQIITVDGPGLGTSNPSTFNFEKLGRPIYPFDDV